MTQWLCIHQPGNRLYLCEADTSAEAARACDTAHGIIAPDSSVSQVFLATAVQTSDDRPIATDGMGSWFGVDDLDIKMLSWNIQDADDIEVALKQDTETHQMRQRHLSYEQWHSRYIPETNTLNEGSSFDGCLYETYGDDLHNVEGCAQNRIWTLIEADGIQTIVPGKQTINHVGYFITYRPFGLTSAPSTIHIDVNPCTNPKAFLRCHGFEISDEPTPGAYVLPMTKDITIVITERASEIARLSPETGARAQIFVNTKTDFSIPYDVEISNIYWLPCLLISAKIHAFSMIENPIDQIEAEYSNWLMVNNLPNLDPQDLVRQAITNEQRTFLAAFIPKWNIEMSAIKPREREAT